MRHDYAGVVERLELLRAPLEYAWGVMSHLTGVKNSDPLREAHEALQVRVRRFSRGGWRWDREVGRTGRGGGVSGNKGEESVRSCNRVFGRGAWGGEEEGGCSSPYGFYIEKPR